MLWGLFFLKHSNWDDEVTIALPDFPSFYYENHAMDGQTLRFLVSDRQNSLIIFHEFHQIQLTIDCRADSGDLRSSIYTAQNQSLVISTNHFLGIESFTLTAISAHRVSFSVFNHRLLGHTFITNRLNSTFENWESLPQFRCRANSTISFIFNISGAYVLTSGTPGRLYSGSESRFLCQEDVSLTRPSLLRFVGISCCDSFNLTVESDMPQPQIVEMWIPDRSIGYTDLPMSFEPGPPESGGTRKMLAIGLLLVGCIAVVISLVLRELYQGKKQPIPAKPPVSIEESHVDVPLNSFSPRLRGEGIWHESEEIESASLDSVDPNPRDLDCAEVVSPYDLPSDFTHL
jgi:hypothetical protein